MKKLLFAVMAAFIAAIPFYATTSGSHDSELSEDSILKLPYFDVKVYGNTLRNHYRIEANGDTTIMGGYFVDFDHDNYTEDDTSVCRDDSIADLMGSDFDDEDIFEPYQADYTTSTYYFEELGIPFPLNNLSDDLDNKDYDKVLADAECVLALLPDDPYACYAKINALDGLGRVDEALELATNCFATYPADEDFLTIVEFLAYDNVEKLINMLESITDNTAYEDAVSDYIQMQLASLCLKNGLSARAIHFCDKMVTDEYKTDAVPALKMSAYTKLDLPEKGLEVSESVSPDDRDASWAQQTAILLRNAYGPESSFDFLKEQSEKYPDDFDLTETYISSLTLAGQYDEALALINTNLNSIQSTIGEIERYGTNITESVARYYEELNAMKANLMLRRGIIYHLNGNKDAANDCFNEVLGTEPPSMRCMAFAYLGQRDEALKIAESYSRLYSFLVSIYNILGDTDKALECLGEAYSKGILSPHQTKYDIGQRSLLDDPRYPSIRAKFAPAL